MRVLWVTNIAIPQIARDINAEIIPLGGWMVRLADEISSIKEIELTIAFPYSRDVKGRVNEIDYFGFCLDNKKIRLNDIGTQGKKIKEFLEESQPEVVHLFGTEYRHSYVFAKICEELGIKDRVVVSIQGLLSFCAIHYEAYLPHKVIVGKTFRDYIKGNVAKGKRRFLNGAILEKEVLRITSNVIGRTDWDKECSYLINPNRKYFFNNEMLRESFYSCSKWKQDNCFPHRIFMSQSVLPYKGLHIVIEAIHLLKPDFPDICLCIAGRNYEMKGKWKRSYYEKYVFGLIKKYGLESNIKFLGVLKEADMCQEYLKAQVFVSASSIENSPNSVCEAMYIGTPVVTSLTGGIMNLLAHGESGYVYQPDAPYMLAHYIRKIFDENETTSVISKEEIKRAELRHEPNVIISDLVGIYKEILD